MTGQRPGPAEIVVWVRSQPDDFDRSSFVAWWRDPRTPAEGGPPDHLRGQVFFTSLTSFTRRAEEDRLTVRRVDHRPDWAIARKARS